MFNPERLLGGLLHSGMRGRSGLGSLAAGGVALGLVGVAMEAVEHYLNRSQAAPGAGVPPGPPPDRTGTPSVPPPPPPAAAPRQAFASQSQQQSEAILLIRAMIAAAQADGVMDAEERAGIMQKLQTAQISEAEKSFILKELSAPQDMERIAGAATTMQLARQIYMVSLLAIDVDTEAERRYMQKLALRLGLDPTAVSHIRRQLGLAPE